MSEVVIIEACSTPGKPCLYLDDYRIAGGKPWGGGRIIHRWPVLIKDLVAALDIDTIAALEAELKRTAPRREGE